VWPLQLYGVVFNQFMPEGSAMFVTYGVKHIKFWISAVDEVRHLIARLRTRIHVCGHSKTRSKCSTGALHT
jgi:hypothetical protein